MLSPDDEKVVFNPLVSPVLTSSQSKSITNILLILRDVGSWSTFYNDCNSSTFPILLESGSSRADVKALLQQHWTSIDRIGFVFHDPTASGNLRFLEYESLFSSADLVKGASSFSPSVSFLIDLVKTFSVKHIDFLACNTLLYPRWKSYYDLLASQTGAIIGASDDETGNQKYGGNWILENTKEDVADLYFTGAIRDFTGTLAQSIGPGVVSFDPSTASWPVTIAANTTVTMTNNATLTATNNYFILGGDNISIDGNGYIFTVTVNEYPGLVLNGTATASSGKSNITLSNLRVESTTYYLSAAAGWIGQIYFGTDATDILFSYCSSNGPIGAYVDGIIDIRRNGGICGGSNVASTTLSPNSGQITAQYCYSTGEIIGQEAGGIFGRRAGSFGGSVTAIHCYSTGNQPLIFSGASVRISLTGGIFGIRAGNDGTATALNCYSTGDMLAARCGGIFGAQAAETDAYPTYGVGTVTATNCYSTGIIGSSFAGADFCGGILGYLASVSNSNNFGAGSVGGGIFTLSKCYSTGAINSYSGGIVGGQCCYNSIQTCTITDCYSTGAISGSYAGGIVALNAGYNDENAGGSPTLNITNCYSQGSLIADSTVGGIIGGEDTNPRFANPIIVNITNSYMLGAGSYVGTGYGAYMTLTTTNDYNVNGGAWSDTNASGALTGTPSTFPGSGVVWTSTAAGTPFIFSSSSPNVPCLCRGMKIATPNGPVLIECLQEGDLVLVPPYNRVVPIKQIFSNRYVGTKKTVPFRIPQHFFEENIPSKDILLSPHHAIFYNGKWRLPIYTPGLHRDESYLNKEFEYFHIELPDYGNDKLWCHNMPVDSWDGITDPLDSHEEETCASSSIDQQSTTNHQILFVA